MQATLLAICLNAIGGLFSTPHARQLLNEPVKITQQKEILALFEEYEKKRETKPEVRLRARL